MSVMDNIIENFAQTITIIKTGKDLLMSGELDLDNTDGIAISVSCYIGKKKIEFDQQAEGNINSFQSYVMALIDINIETHDLLITERGEKYIVGPVSIRNDNTTINNELNAAAYLYADLELWTEP